MDKKLVLYYKKTAENSDIGWERQSLPIGNGYMGGNVFGRYDTERIQITSNEYANPLKEGGLNNFAEIYIDLNHNEVSNYVRGLDLNKAVAFCKYDFNGVHYERECFTSYPDNCLAVKLTCDKNELNFDLRIEIPYLADKPSENRVVGISPEYSGLRKIGEVKTDGNKIVVRGRLPLHGLIFESQATIVTDGKLLSNEDKLTVSCANYAYIYYVHGTSYKLDPSVFLQQDTTKKAIGEDPHIAVEKRLSSAIRLGYDELYSRHIADYSELFSRVELNLTDSPANKPTDELLEDFKEDDSDLHIEELYYQFGRYLLISSSRKGTLPSSLQGVWNVHDRSPWGCGYWHNINVQMNYWPAFSANLAETFDAYADFVKAYIPRAEEIASEYIKEHLPENFVEGQGECGWAIGTGSNAYSINPPEDHSGPGTGGLTSKLFWEYYDFTRDETILKETVYPIMRGMSKFLTKCVKNYDGRYLTAFSASPEQMTSKYWISQLGSKQLYYHTVGCAFDQQLIFENGIGFIKCCDLLGIKDEIYQIQKDQINHYDPIHVGYSGQIKEYEEEHFYGEICEANHRHISHLMALMPGSLINSTTPAWMDAAKKSLEYRGDKSTGWALAHRLCAWARTGDGEHAYHLFKTLLKNRTYSNLWDWHPPFQIDGNFGAVAGVTEMLMQSHEGFVSILPTLPVAWKNGSFKGFKARGNFTVSCEWKNGFAEKVTVESVIGGDFKLKYPGSAKATVKDSEGNVINFTADDNFISFGTTAGSIYTIEGFEKIRRYSSVSGLSYTKKTDDISICWNKTEKGIYRIYKCVNDDPDYKFLGELKEEKFCDKFDDSNSIQSYKVTVYDGENILTESISSVITVHNASQLEIDRYNHKFRQNNI